MIKISSSTHVQNISIWAGASGTALGGTRGVMLQVLTGFRARCCVDVVHLVGGAEQSPLAAFLLFAVERSVNAYTRGERITSLKKKRLSVCNFIKY